MHYSLSMSQTYLALFERGLQVFEASDWVGFSLLICSSPSEKSEQSWVVTMFIYLMDLSVLHFIGMHIVPIMWPVTMMAILAIVSLVSMVMSLCILIHSVSTVSPIIINFPVCLSLICDVMRGGFWCVCGMCGQLFKIWSIKLLWVIVANA